MIEVDQHALASEEFSDELGIQTDHTDKVYTSKNTCCRTFRPRNQNNREQLD